MDLSPQLDQQSPVLLCMSGIHKHFPGVHALKGVDFDVFQGEVHALVGENGAGKSTLMHILAGVQPQDEGTISFNGAAAASAGSGGVHFAGEQEAQLAGIGIVYQERSLVPTLNVAENVFAARQPVGVMGFIDRPKLYRQTQHILDKLRIQIKPTEIVEDISPALQQMIEIAKAISMDARLLIFDEPTAALTEKEKAILFELICELKKHVGIIYISHRLEEIFEIADRVTVLKDGENRGTFPVGEVDREKLISLMVGRKTLKYIDRSRETNLDEVQPILEVRDLSDAERVKNVSFSLKPGEIVAFAGLSGAGRTETALAIFGAASRKAGEILIHGKKVNITSPEDAIRAGIGYLPEDRRSAGLFLEMAISHNIASARLGHFGKFILNKQRMTQVANEYRQKLSIAAPHVSNPVQNLSGGNQQKVVISRWLLVNPEILIVDEPTRGIDVGAKAEVHSLLNQLARQGTAILIISSELPEVLSVADRILVMCDGRISGELDGRTATEEQILNLASAFEPR